MIGRYIHTQTAYTGPQGTVKVKVEHDYDAAVPISQLSRTAAYLRQNGINFHPGLVSPDSVMLTVAQRRQLRRTERRAHARSLRDY